MMVYFFPHAYLRDRQLDTIRHWTAGDILNRELFEHRAGAQVSKEKALTRRRQLPWKQRLPLLNIKWRPRGLPQLAIVYVWGGIIASGRYIVELDNPYALTGYNVRAMIIYRRLLQLVLSRRRCVGIRCISQACRETLNLLFGNQIYSRAEVQYPYMKRMIAEVPSKRNRGCRFLFVGTQFDIKGGVALLRAFRRVYAAEPTAELRVITHLPPEYASIVEQCPGITIHEAHFRREEIFEHFMQDADVLVHPSYMESFGMAVLEAIAHGLAVVGTDMYALREMIEDGVNGALLTPPISIWDGFLPSRYYSDSPRFKEYVQRADTSLFEDQLTAAMLQLAQNPELLLKARQASLKLFAQKFERIPTRVASERL